MRRPKREANWEFVRGWAPEGMGPPHCSWTGAQKWIKTAADSVVEVERTLGTCVERWEGWLAPLGEVSSEDWQAFRPLRLAREEAWTDWLAHLLQQSKSGLLGNSLFAGHVSLSSVSSFAFLRVAREVSTMDGSRRADILVEWPQAVAHVEVKVGDQAFEKTCETSRLLEATYGKGRAWADFVLLPPTDVDLWMEVAGDDTRAIQVLTWLDVAAGLRRALRRGDERLPWRTWAHAFCGAVEQRLLGCESAMSRASTRPGIGRLASALAQIEVMRKGEL